MLNWAICKNTLQELKSNKLRAILLSGYFLLPLFMSTAELSVMNQFSNTPIWKPAHARYFALIWSIGVIGRQAQDGTLSLILSRPLKISEYISSKWFAVACAASVSSLLQLLAEIAVAATRTPQLLDPVELVCNGSERALLCFALTAVIVFLSSLVSGVKDIGIYIALAVVGKCLESISQIRLADVPAGIWQLITLVAVRVSDWVSNVFALLVTPSIDIQSTFMDSGISWSAILAWAAVITACLSLAILRTNRRELPYGAD